MVAPGGYQFANGITTYRLYAIEGRTSVGRLKNSAAGKLGVKKWCGGITATPKHTHIKRKGKKNCLPLWRFANFTDFIGRLHRIPLSSGGDYKRILFIGFDAGQGWMLRGFFIEAVGFSLFRLKAVILTTCNYINFTFRV